MTGPGDCEEGRLMTDAIRQPPDKRPKDNSRYPHKCRHDHLILTAPTGIDFYHCVSCGADAPIQDWDMTGRRVIGPRLA